jgi:hypothetical protein
VNPAQTPASKWKWVYHIHDRTKLYQVGILADGTLHNPNGYPEDVVRESVRAAYEKRHQRRSEAAQKAAVTRKKRQERKVYQTAERIVGGHKLGPRLRCVICNKGLADQESIDRGIGSDCWQGVLGLLTGMKDEDKSAVATYAKSLNFTA